MGIIESRILTIGKIKVLIHYKMAKAITFRLPSYSISFYCQFKMLQQNVYKDDVRRP